MTVSLSNHALWRSDCLISLAEIVFANYSKRKRFYSENSLWWDFFYRWKERYSQRTQNVSRSSWHDYVKKHKVFHSGQKRGINKKIKSALKRLSCVEPIIGHLKNHFHLGRNFLKGIHGDKGEHTCSGFRV